jgi:hypothetical protein
MNLDQFFASYNGKSLDYDNAYGVQCVDLAKFYLRECYGIHPGAWGNAHAYFTATNPAILSRFNRITNNPKDLNQRPSRGDIVVWGSALPGSEGSGHIAVYDAKTAPGTFRSFDANWGGKTYHFVTHNYNNVIGWLTPKPAPVAAASAPAASQPQGGIILNDAQVQKLYNLVLHRTGDAGGIKNYSGKSLDFFLNDIGGSQEWRGQNHELLVSLPEIRAQAANLQNSINQQNQAITELTQKLQSSEASGPEKQKALDGAIAKLSQTTAELETAHDKIVELEKKAAAIGSGSKVIGLPQSGVNKPKISPFGKLIVAFLNAFAKKKK